MHFFFLGAKTFLYTILRALAYKDAKKLKKKIIILHPQTLLYLFY